MGFGMLAFGKATGAASTDQDMVATADTDFPGRNSHQLFTLPFNLIGQFAQGATLTRMNVGSATWNAIGKFNLWPITIGATIPSPPQMQWLDQLPSYYGGYGVPIPMMEEFQVFNTDGASEQVTYFMWISTPDQVKNLPPGKMPFWVRCTTAVAGLANLWSGPGAITMEQTLRGGVYAVVGATAWATNVQAFRIVFPRYKLYGGIRLRPGFLASNAAGDLGEARSQVNPYVFGEWGRFHSFELPQVEHYKTASSATALEVRLALIYLGQDDSLLQGGQGGAGAGGYTAAGIPGLAI
jgi:hypothetical protein